MKLKIISISKGNSWRVAAISVSALLLLVSLLLLVPIAYAEVHFTACPLDSSQAETNDIIAIPLGTVMTGTSFTPETGDEIAVFRPAPNESVCAGSTIYDSTANGVITVWGDLEGVNGMVVGEIMQWRIWDASEDTEYYAIVTYEGGFDGAYVGESIHTLASLVPNGPTAVTLTGAGAAGVQPSRSLLLLLAGMGLITIVALKSPRRKME